MLAIPARVIAIGFALVCFAATILAGLFNGNAFDSVLYSALLVSVIAWVVGTILGMLLLRSVNEQIERHRIENPIPDENELFESDPVQAGTG